MDGPYFYSNTQAGRWLYSLAAISAVFNPPLRDPPVIASGETCGFLFSVTISLPSGVVSLTFLSKRRAENRLWLCGGIIPATYMKSYLLREANRHALKKETGGLVTWHRNRTLRVIDLGWLRFYTGDVTVSSFSQYQNNKIVLCCHGTPNYRFSGQERLVFFSWMKAEQRKVGATVPIGPCVPIVLCARDLNWTRATILIIVTYVHTYCDACCNI